MVTYEVERPDGAEDGIRVRCPEHDVSEHYPAGRRRVRFHCPDCGFELAVSLHDCLDARPWGERC